MIAPGVPFDDIDASHLQALIDGAYAESQTIEYKRELEKPTSAGKKEFLNDASSFANTVGGDLLYGIAAKAGVPTDFSPLTGEPDADILALESSLQGGVSPRIPGVQVGAINVEGGYVLLLRIPKSWAGPHAVTFEGSFRFWARNSGGKYSLDVAQLRAAFLGSTALADRVRAFRADRLAQIGAGETPVPLQPNPKIVVHLIPYEAFGAISSLELNAIQGSGLFHPPFRPGAQTTRWNLDGLLTYNRLHPDQGAFAYAQLFRNGIYEGVEASIISTEPDAQYRARIIYGGWMDSALGRGLANPFAVLERIGVRPPIVVLVSVLGIKDYWILAGPAALSNFRDHRVDRDPLNLPDVVIESFVPGRELPALLRPLLDAFWQAGGWQGSPHFDESGNLNLQ